MSNRHNGNRGSRDREGTLNTGQTRPRSPSEALEPARAPSRPKRRRVRERSRRLLGFTRVLSGLLTVVLAVMLAAGGMTLWLFHEFERQGPLAVSRTFGVPRGEGPIEISARLEREGVISNRWAFVASHSLRNFLARGKPMHLKAGEYEFKKGASMRDVLATLVEGKSILRKITLPEGLTSAQIVERLMADENLVGEIAEIPAEGSLLPDTYRFSKGMERQDLIDRMKAEQQRFLASVWEKRQPDLPVATPAEALILASVIEKETGRADERERVAAVFVNRLRKGMRLQSDPTIIYGIVGGKGSLGRPITREDINTKTSHNTYQIKGLPPTPICNPGRSAIEATLNPAATADLYFVADGSGGHAFSETLKDHNAAVSNWRKIERQAKAQAPAANAAPDTAPPPSVAADSKPDTGPVMPAVGATADGGAGSDQVAPGTVLQKTRAVSRLAPQADGATATAPVLPTVTTINRGPPEGEPATGTTAAGVTAAAARPVPLDVPVPTRKPKR